MLRRTYTDRASLEKALKNAVNDFSNEDFSDLDISGLEFQEGTNFTGSDFSMCDMRRIVANGCIFRGAAMVEVSASYADFSGSNFFESSADRADFTHANFSDCDMHLMRIHRARFDTQVLPWLPAVIDHGVRMPNYRLDGIDA